MSLLRPFFSPSSNSYTEPHITSISPSTGFTVPELNTTIFEGDDQLKEVDIGVGVGISVVEKELEVHHEA